MTPSPHGDQSNEEASTGRPSDPDPVPGDVVAGARAAYGALEPHELAVLVHDSLLDADAHPEDHLLRFEQAGANVEVHVSADVSNTVIEGSVDPPGPVNAVLHIDGSELAIVAPIEDGSFRFTPVGHGLIRIALEGHDRSSTIWTDWFRI